MHYSWRFLWGTDVFTLHIIIIIIIIIKISVRAEAEPVMPAHPKQ
jgi:hypothetical protein